MSLAQYLLDIIFPPVCIACKKYLKSGMEKSLYICNICTNKLDYLPGFICPVCLKRLPSVALAKDGLPPCHKEAQFILAAPLKYSNQTVQEIIRVFKYESVKTAANPLIQVFYNYFLLSIKDLPFNIEDFILIPIPIHFFRKRKRGFNQAAIISEKLKEKLNIPIILNVLTRKRAVLSQTKKKDYDEREKNVRGSFAIKNPELILNKNILLVDDVFTSGATMREAVRVLKLAGAQKIIALALARA